MDIIDKEPETDELIKEEDYIRTNLTSNGYVIILKGKYEGGYTLYKRVKNNKIEYYYILKDDKKIKVDKKVARRYTNEINYFYD